MVQRFGSREICDVTFKALNQMTLPNGKIAKAGQPVFVIDTATTSTMEQASTVVYAQGGRGYNRLIAWEGEKTITFNVTDALMSPMGLSMLTDAGITDASDSKPIHVHTTIDATTKPSDFESVSSNVEADFNAGKYYTKDASDNYVKATGTYSSSSTYYVPTKAEAEVDLEILIDELGLLPSTTSVLICNDSAVRPYATVLDQNGAIKDWMNTVTVSSNTVANVDATNLVVKVEKNAPAIFKISNVEGTTSSCPEDGASVKLDFYVVMKSGATQITIHPDDFGGYFYVEADTLYRNEDGKDMAATLTYPKVKINSAFTITMAANGDPSTFDFQMDAMPAYTYFDRSKKVVCDIAIVGGSTADSGIYHSSNDHIPAGE